MRSQLNYLIKLIYADRFHLGGVEDSLINV